MFFKICFSCPKKMFDTTNKNIDSLSFILFNLLMNGKIGQLQIALSF